MYSITNDSNCDTKEDISADGFNRIGSDDKVVVSITDNKTNDNDLKEHILIDGFIRIHLNDDIIIPINVVNICFMFYVYTRNIFLFDKVQNNFFVTNFHSKRINTLITDKDDDEIYFSSTPLCYIENISSSLKLDKTKNKTYYDGIIGLIGKDCDVYPRPQHYRYNFEYADIDSDDYSSNEFWYDRDDYERDAKYPFLLLFESINNTKLQQERRDFTQNENIKYSVYVSSEPIEIINCWLDKEFINCFNDNCIIFYTDCKPEMRQLKLSDIDLLNDTNNYRISNQKIRW